MQRSHHAADATAANDDLRELMEDVPGGPNHGRVASADPQTFGRHEALGTTEHDFEAGGFSVVFPSPGGAGTLGDAGMTSHRGVLHPDEYVDARALRVAVEGAFGFTTDEVRSVYARGVAGGPLPFSLRGLRGRIDARLLALLRAGANLQTLARAFGLPADEHGCDAFDRALARARGAEEVAA